MRRDKSYTLMLIPHHSRKPCSFRLNSVTFVILVSFLIAGFSGLLFLFLGFNSRVNAQRELESLRSLTVKQDRDIKSMSVALDELRVFGKKVKTMTGIVGEREATEETGGQGGPVPYWPIEQFLTPKKPVSPGNLLLEPDQLKREIFAEKNNYRNLISRLEEQDQLWASTPSICPVNGGYISSPYGMRRNPRREFHYGIDLVAPRGTPVYSAAAGRVIFAGWDGPYGNKVVVSHGNGFKTVYGHLDKIKIRWGEIVKKGQTVGTLGNTGRSTGPHLHYEVQKDGQRVDPEEYILVRLR